MLINASKTKTYNDCIMISSYLKKNQTDIIEIHYNLTVMTMHNLVLQCIQRLKICTHAFAVHSKTK